MIHDKTLLFSANSNVKTATLSEPLSAFERFAIVTAPNTYRESTVSANCNRRIDTIGTYNTDGYMIWPTNVVVGGDTKTLDVNHFQLMMQQGTNTGTRTFGFNNTANNCNRILEVYGINRKDGTTAAGEGSPGEGYTAYNETLLVSGLSPNMTGDIQLSDRANAFHRLKVGVGAYGENVNIYDVDSPVNWTGWLPLYSYWGTNTGSYYFSEHRYKFSNSATVLTPISGKTHQLGTGTANPYTTTGNYTATDTHIRHPLFAVWGINKKSPRSLTLLPTTGGTQSASDTSGYEYDQITMSNTPDEGWYFSGYNVTGATINGNIITLHDENASAQAGFTDEGFPVTYLSDEHVHLTGDVAIYIPGSEGITLDSGYDTYYRISGYDITNGSIVDGKLVPTGPCTIKAVQKVNAFTASGTFQNIQFAMDSNYHSTSSYPRLSYRSNNVPTGWSASRNGITTWNPGSNISSYKMFQKISIAVTSTYNNRFNCKYNIGSTNLYNYSELSKNKTITFNRSDSKIGIPCIFCSGQTRVGCTGRNYNWSATGILP